MKKFFVLLTLLFASSFAAAQNTTISATITDSDSIAWANGTYTITFYNPSQSQPPVYVKTGQKIQTIFKGSLDASGSFTVSIPDNAQVYPVSSWDFKLCSNTSAPCTTITGIYVTGSSINLTSKLSAAVIAPRFTALGNAFGYSTVEVLFPEVGNQFFNVTSNCEQSYTGTGWVCSATGGPFVHIAGDTMTGALNTPSINSILNASLYPGSDIGAKINAAAAAMPSTGGEIHVPSSASCYNYATPIVLPDHVTLKGDNKIAVCLNFTPTSGDAITVGNWSTLSNVEFRGAAGTSVGLLLHGAYSRVQSVVITGFGTGITFGNNTYLDNFHDVNVYSNTQNMLYPAGLTNSGENISFHSSTFATSTTYTNCVELGVGSMLGQTFTFESTSFDHCQIVNNDSNVRLDHVHFEDGTAITAPFVVTWGDQYTGQYGLIGATTITDSDIFIDNATSINGLFEVQRFGSLSIMNLKSPALGSTPLTYLTNLNSGGSPILNVFSPDIPFSATQIYSVAATTPATNPVVNFKILGTSESSNTGSDIWTSNNLSNWLKNSAFVRYADGSDFPSLGMYRWTGSGTTFYGMTLKVNASGNLEICHSTTGTITEYGQLGSESMTCDAGDTGGAIYATSYNIGTNTILPSTLTGYNGNASGVKVPLSLAWTTPSTFTNVCHDANGNLTDSGCPSGTGTPTMVAGPAAGTSPTVSFTGNDGRGIITVITGTAPATNGALVTVTLSAGCTNKVVAVLFPANIQAQVAATDLSLTGQTSTQYEIEVGPTALTPSSTYEWNYIAQCY